MYQANTYTKGQVMQKQLSKAKATIVAMVVAAFAVVGFVPSASAHTGEFSKFDFCPSTNPSVDKCLQAVTSGGKVVLGKKNVPIVNPATVQGGVGVPNGEFVSTFTGATNGVTLSKAPQPVPGGLLGIVPPESSPPIVKEASKFFFENGLTGVNSTLELARPASEIKVSELSLIGEEGVALRLPVKVHLENPFLGSSCYVGSSSSPLIWNLTTGQSGALHGTPGTAKFKEGGLIFQLTGAELVDTAWSAPHATGCGGFLIELLVNPIIDSTVGLPAASGNVAVLKNTINLATAFAVNAH